MITILVRHGWKFENGPFQLDLIKGGPLTQELTDVLESIDPDNEFEEEDEPELVN